MLEKDWHEIHSCISPSVIEHTCIGHISSHWVCHNVYKRSLEIRKHVFFWLIGRSGDILLLLCVKIILRWFFWFDIPWLSHKQEHESPDHYT